MSRFRIIMLAMFAVFALGAVASASASAAPVLEVCKEKAGEGKEPPKKYDTALCNTQEKELKLRKFEWVAVATAEPVTSTGGEFKLTAGTKVVTCKSVTDKGTVGPGVVDFAEEIKFTECTTGTAGCEVRSKNSTPPPFGTVLVTDINTEFAEPTAGHFTDTFFQKNTTPKEFVTLEFKGTSCAAAGYVETKVKGDVAAEATNNANGTVTLTFPKTPLTVPVKLEAFGVSATLEGADVEKLASGAGLRVAA